ncbi:MAG: FHA domain-containing protein [Verrucomicrobiota bacterium]
MASMLAKCPNPACACPVQPGDDFCPNCGHPLDAAVEVPSGCLALETDLTPLTSKPTNALDVSNDAASPRLDHAEHAHPPTQTAVEAQQHNDCAELEVRYNNSCVFVLNMQSTFDFEIRPLAEGIRDLFVEVRHSGQTIARQTPMVLPKRGVPIHFGLNYMPRNTSPGKVSFEILVGCRKGIEQRLYAAYRTHTIYSGKEDPRRVCDHLVVEVKNNIQQGHAGDLQVDQSFHGLREALHEGSSIELDKEFLGLINGRPFWTALPLAECAPNAVPAPARRASVVLQETGGATIHLLTQSPLRIGRARDCEIVARVYGPAGDELKPESMRLSRYHAVLEWKENCCRLLDRGYYPDQAQWRPSSTGLWVDGKRIPSGGEFSLAPDHEYHIALSEPAGADKPQFDLAVRLWTVRDIPVLRSGCAKAGLDPQTPACVVLRRLHGPPISFLLLRHAASLGWVDPQWNGACVCLRHNALGFNDGHTCDWLVPGRRLRSGEGQFEAVDGLRKADG